MQYLYEAKAFLLDGEEKQISSDCINDAITKLNALFSDESDVDYALNILRAQNDDAIPHRKQLQIAFVAIILKLEDETTDEHYREQFLQGLKILESISIHNRNSLSSEAIYEILLIMLTHVAPIRVRITYFYEAVLDYYEKTWFQNLEPNRQNQLIQNYANNFPLQYENFVTKSQKSLTNQIPALLIAPILSREISIAEATAIIERFNIAHMRAIQLELAIIRYYTQVFDAFPCDVSGGYVSMNFYDLLLLSRSFIEKHKDNFLKYVDTYVDSRIPREDIEQRFKKPFYMRDFSIIQARQEEFTYSPMRLR